MRRRALFVGLVTSSVLAAAVGTGSLASAMPLGAPVTAVRAAATAWPAVDPDVADPADTVAVPRTPEVSPTPRRVLASSGGTRLILQPDADAVWWLWWQRGTDAPVRSQQRVLSPVSLAVSASAAHVVVRDSGYLTVDLASRSIARLALQSGWRFVAATPDGYVDFNDTTKVLRRHLGDGSTATVATDAGFTTSPGSRPAAADATGVVLSAGGVRWYPFDGSPSVVLASGQYLADTFALSPSSVAWTTREWKGTDTEPAQPPSVRRVLKTGGAVASAPIDPSRYVTDLQITDSATAWSGDLWSPKETADTSSRFAAVADADLTDVTPLAALNATSVVAEDDHFLLVDTKPAADAGLYAVAADGSSTLQARTTPPLRSVRAFAFDGSQVLEEQLENGASRQVGFRRVAGAGFGPFQFLNLPSTSTPVTLALTAGRLARQGGQTTFYDLDATGGMPTFCCGAGAPAVQQVEASGTLAVVGGAVVDMTTGQARATLAGARSWAVFGSTVVWSTDTGEVWRRTLTSAPAKVLAAACTSGCAAQVGVWGDRIVVQPKVGDLQVRTTSGALVRTLPALPTAATPWTPALTLEDGILAWVQPVSGHDGVLRVVDVNAADPTVVDVAQAVQLPGVRSVELRDGRLMWLAPDRGLRAARQPLTRQPRTMLYSLSTPTAFSPNGDAVQDAWVVTGSATAPLTGQVSIDVARSGSLVRTVSAAPRSGRFTLSWDGRTTSGAAAAEGSYTWTLRGTSASGRPLGGLNGPVSGTVTLRRTAAAATISAPAITSSATASGIWPVSFRPTTTQPSWSPARFELQARPYWVGSRVSSAAYWATYTTTSAQQVSFDRRRNPWPHSATWLFRVRVLSPGGLTGPWSQTVRSTLPLDDASGSYVGSWTALRQSWAYLGTQHRANSATSDVVLSPSTASSRVSVVMTRCSHCGKVKISVDGGSWLTVDTYSPTTRSRQVVYHNGLRWGVHRVRVINLATHGRPYAYLDGVSFEP